MSILVLTQTGGILKPFAIILGFIMNYIYRFLQIFGINNVGLTIILFTLVINVLMIPLTVKQQKFSKMSSLMNPELQKVQKKYQNRKDEKSMRMMQAETQAIYDKYGASPTGGCLPMLIQMPIIMGLFEKNVPVDSITVMVQKEVADRMQVGPGTKDYGALSLAVQYYAKPEIVANVPPNCFMPRPKVGSAVIKLTRYEKPPVDVKDEGLMFRLIRASFNQRRKTLVNGIRNSGDFSLSKEEIEDVFNRCDLPLNIRGEALTLEQFAMLANCIYDEKN